MPSTIAATEVPNHIRLLLAQRQQHTDAISSIDKTLAGVMAALGGAARSATPPKLPSPPVAKKAPATKAKKTRRGKFAVSAADLILAFLKTKPATTREISGHLVGQGRSTSSVSNALSVLTKAKKLKRTPLGIGEPGSTYALA